MVQGLRICLAIQPMVGSIPDWRTKILPASEQLSAGASAAKPTPQLEPLRRNGRAHAPQARPGSAEETHSLKNSKRGKWDRVLVYKYSQLGQGTLFSASLALSMVFDTKGFACTVSFNPTSPIIILLYPFYRQWLPRWLSGERIYLQCRRRRRHRRPELDAWIRKIPWRRKWHPTPVFLPGKPHGQRSLLGYSPWVAKSRLDTTEWLTHTHTLLQIRKVKHK